MPQRPVVGFAPLALRPAGSRMCSKRTTSRDIHGDKGYHGHNHPHRFKVWITGQVRRVTKSIRREMRRRTAVEPVIGHLKDDHRVGRHHLKSRDGDRINAVLPVTTSAYSAAGLTGFCVPCG